ncbi:hypothetical protein M6B38_387460 [Iris pallida]|uniref:Uncharacterized protein n=1 Tax=Iris pallida TaxID=29817 RepID=A0AAX6G2V7_IRIPA|nr:hypothetical protein M6B38_387460 [Iris pallida]
MEGLGEEKLARRSAALSRRSDAKAGHRRSGGTGDGMGFLPFLFLWWRCSCARAGGLRWCRDVSAHARWRPKAPRAGRCSVFGSAER